MAKYIILLYCLGSTCLGFAQFDNDLSIDDLIKQLETTDTELQEAAALYDLAVTPSDPKALDEFYIKTIELATRDQAMDQVIIEKIKQIKQSCQCNIDPQLPNLYYQQGLALAKTKKYDQAIDAFHQSLKINIQKPKKLAQTHRSPKADEIIDPFAALLAIEKKADILRFKYQLNEEESLLLTALQSYDSAIDLYVLIRRKYGNKSLRTVHGDKIKRISEKGIETALQLYEITQKTSYKEQAFLFAEKSRNTVMLDALLEADAKEIGLVPSSLSQLEKQLAFKLSYFQMDQPNEKDSIFYYQQALFTLREKVKQTYPKSQQWEAKGQDISIPTIQKKLEEDTGILSYFVGINGMYSFLLSKDSLHIHHHLAVDDTEIITKQLIQKISTSDFYKNPKEQFQSFAKLSQRAYDYLIQPQEKPLNQLKHLVIIQDGFLNFLPFEVLVQSIKQTEDPDYSLSNCAYLLKNWSIQYAPSIFSFNKARSNEEIKLSLAGFAPQFEGKKTSLTRSCSSQKLIHNQQEVEGILDWVNGKAFLGDQASKAQFLSEYKDYSILHLATHSCPSDHPLKSQIVFADTSLLAKEIYYLDMRDKLVVLSACETGVGELNHNDGILSLARSFEYANAQAVLKSLWAVADQSTADLMQLFYKKINKGVSPNQALNQAKVDFLKENTTLYQHPFYWAPFVYHSSNFQPITYKNTDSTFYWMGILFSAFLLIGLFFFLKK